MKSLSNWLHAKLSYACSLHQCAHTVTSYSQQFNMRPCQIETRAEPINARQWMGLMQPPTLKFLADSEKWRRLQYSTKVFGAW